MFGVYWGIVAGVIINGLLLALGARPVHFAVLNALPLLTQVFGLYAARILQEHDVRKGVVLVSEGLSRGLWALLPLLLLLPAEGYGRVWFVLAVAALSHLLHAGGVVAWLSWVSDLVPEQIRGLYFGARTAITGVIGTAGVTLASIWADGARRDHVEGSAYLEALLLTVGVALLFAALSWMGLLVQPVRRMRNLVARGWRAIGATLAAPEGRPVARTWAAFAFSTGITMGLFTVFFLDRLSMSFLGVTVYGWVSLLVSLAMTPVLGRLADRYGHRKLLALAWLGVFWQPMISVLTPNDAPHLLGLMPLPILLDAVLSGCFWPAVGVAQNNLVIAQVRSEHRASLFAALSALAGVTGFLGAVAGGLIADAIGERHGVQVLGLRLDDLRFPMVVGCLLRLLAGLTILGLREPARTREPVASAHAFSVVWRLLAGKPLRPISR